MSNRKKVSDWEKVLIGQEVSIWCEMLDWEEREKWLHDLDRDEGFYYLREVGWEPAHRLEERAEFFDWPSDGIRKKPLRTPCDGCGVDMMFFRAMKPVCNYCRS